MISNTASPKAKRIACVSFPLLVVLAVQFYREAWSILPSSFLHIHGSTESGSRWLILTMSRVPDRGRRNIIRSSWQRKYNSPDYDTRFVLSGHDEVWDSVIQQENATYGDLIVLNDLEPNWWTSNSIKSMEALRHVVQSVEDGSMKGYDWVSKIDDDSFPVAGPFYHDFLDVPYPSDRTLISRRSRNEGFGDFDWPAGAFYTMSWGLITKLVQIHTDTPLSDVPEDVLIGQYLHDHQVEFDYVHLSTRRMFDIPGEGANVVGRISRETRLVHRIKDDETYLRIASAFDGNGYTGKQINELTMPLEDLDSTDFGALAQDITPLDRFKFLDIVREPEYAREGDDRGPRQVGVSFEESGSRKTLA